MCRSTQIKVSARHQLMTLNYCEWRTCSRSLPSHLLREDLNHLLHYAMSTLTSWMTVQTNIWWCPQKLPPLQDEIGSDESMKLQYYFIWHGHQWCFIIVICDMTLSAAVSFPLFLITRPAVSILGSSSGCVQPIVQVRVDQLPLSLSMWGNAIEQTSSSLVEVYALCNGMREVWKLEKMTWLLIYDTSQRKV